MFGKCTKEDLEEKLEGKRARLRALMQQMSRLTHTNDRYINMVLDLNEEIATLEFKLKTED